MHFLLEKLLTSDALRSRSRIRNFFCGRPIGRIRYASGSRLITAAALYAAFAVSPVQAGYPVFDAQNLTQMLVDSIGTIEQWGIDNQQQAEQLRELLTANDLTRVNSEMNNLGSWQQIDALCSQSLQLVYAASSLWKEYGSLADFYSGMRSAEAWLKCYQSGSCSFERYIKTADEMTVAGAKQAAAHAASMQEHLNEKAELIKTLKQEGAAAKGHADILDNLSKINAETASSLVDLNSQSAVLVELISREQALEADKRQAHNAWRENFFSTPWPKQPHADLTLPDFD